ncbi:MAG TPA: hypothetical protein VNW92_30715 [Polyangiaceae bacterium]|nr:hypothetical protein [Polyangiaceae bacterium]
MRLAAPGGMDLRESEFADRDAIKGVALAPMACQAVEASAEVHRRDEFVWKWAHEAISAVTLSSVSEQHRARAIELKLTYAVLMTALDDAADRRQDAELFDFLRRHVLTLSGAQDHARFPGIAAIWNQLIEALRALSSAHAFMPWFSFDHETVAQAGRYALLVNGLPQAMNHSELYQRNAESFFLHSLADIDLMFAPAVNMAELGVVRAIVGHAQYMCAIANWIGTWERELRERDFSSGVVVLAFERQVLTLRDTEQPEKAIALIRQARLEEHWTAQWERHFRAIAGLPEPSVFDRADYLRGLERVYRLQMLGKGRL